MWTYIQEVIVGSIILLNFNLRVGQTTFKCCSLHVRNTNQKIVNLFDYFTKKIGFAFAWANKSVKEKDYPSICCWCSYIEFKFAARRVNINLNII